ncbi:KH domain-containing protein HEN4 isoform X2 [Hevea brasiliensis]|uniref:KH domain-containing protein HEN4 isoform X2 n=1 Tax=Hevea brasiliensis TaxID=3981 RepID=UPI0025E33DAC|nr:KH domain-containing protein HEN4 isoform X2 [Hevea brasiliensis]
MGSTFLYPPAKRPIQYTTTMPDPTCVNGPSSKRSKPPPPPLPVPPGHASFRLLCHASRIGGVIGKSGNVIKQLQQLTGAKIRVEDAPAESPDRVITIIAQNAIVSKVSVFNDNSGIVKGDVGGQEELDVSKAQEALVRVFERILEVAAESDGMSVAGGVVSCRLLAEAKQVGSVIGKGGKVVEKIRKDCGVKIRVLIDKLPVCAGSTEEMVEIEGDVLAVKKALVAVSRCLQDCQPVDKTRMTGSKPAEAIPEEPVPEVHVDFLSQRKLVLPNMPSSTTIYASRIPSLSLESDRVPTLNAKPLQQEVVFRILCSNDRVGGVIGKGGTIIKAIQNETGASITIGSTVAECDERLITVTAPENPESHHSAAQKTVVLVFSRYVEAGIEKGLDLSYSKGCPVTARLVVPSNHVGCLLGKGGIIISEMRKTTGTGIRVLGGDQVPKCVSENDQVVQISGEFKNVKDAIYHVTGRLRDNLFSSSLTIPGTRSTSVITETSPYGRLREPLRDTMRDVLRDPLPDVLRDPLRDVLREPLKDPLRDLLRNPLRDTLRDPLRDTLRDPLRDVLKEPPRGPAPVNLHSSAGVTHTLNRHATLSSMDHHGLSHGLDRPPSPRLWASQTIAGVNPRAITDASRGLASFKGGLELGSGSKSAFVTNTTVEIVVPENVIGSVYGENGSNLARLRQDLFKVNCAHADFQTLSLPSTRFQLPCIG